MNAPLRKLIEKVESWPDDDQAELLEYAREIESRRKGVYVLSDDERAAIEEGLAQADRGEFATDEEIAAIFKRHGA
jgi:predicted transcriptional regulator